MSFRGGYGGWNSFTPQIVHGEGPTPTEFEHAAAVTAITKAAVTKTLVIPVSR